MKNPNDTATFRLVAQCLNQLRHRVTQKTEQDKKNTLVEYNDDDDGEDEEQKKGEKTKKKKEK